MSGSGRCWNTEFHSTFSWAQTQRWLPTRHHVFVISFWCCCGFVLKSLYWDQNSQWWYFYCWSSNAVCSVFEANTFQIKTAVWSLTKGLAVETGSVIVCRRVLGQGIKSQTAPNGPCSHLLVFSLVNVRPMESVLGNRHSKSKLVHELIYHSLFEVKITKPTTFSLQINSGRSLEVVVVWSDGQKLDMQP